MTREDKALLRQAIQAKLGAVADAAPGTDYPSFGFFLIDILCGSDDVLDLLVRKLEDAAYSTVMDVGVVQRALAQAITEQRALAG